jgi:hypothetical protein
MLLRKPKKAIHPLRNILFILFLCDDIETFFKKSINTKKPFGEDPWPCLNPVASHYKENIITCCNISVDYDTREPVGTFMCSCGFIYSRRGPDKGLEDKLKVGRIKAFGGVWESKLRSYLLENKYGLRALSRLMCCDSKTIVKYSEKLGLAELLNSKQSYVRIEETHNKDDKENLMDKYKKDIVEMVKEYPDYCRQQIRDKFKKQYIYLYRHDKDWLNNNLPRSILNGEKNVNNRYKVDWMKRDKELVQKVKIIHEELLKLEKPIRITKSLIGKKTGSTALLAYYIDKLPRTRKYIVSIVESVDDFRTRRIDIVCKKLYEDKGVLKKWEIVRAAGLRPNYANRVSERINYNIRKCMGEGMDNAL